MSDTIAAIATAIVPEQGSVGIVRLSGSESVAIAKKLFHAPGQQAWESHRILYGFIRHPETDRLIDEALLLLMLAPRSYTREDVIEFHCHGGIMAVQQVLQLCIEQGARLAQPGEFTLRAFLNGRIDLTQAESISDLVGARSPQAAQTALAGLQGKLAHPIRHLRATCLDILAEVEARIDFEDDLPPLDEDLIRSQFDQVLADVTRILETADRGELLRTGLKVAIVGRPNVGKSSLLNAWSRCDRAIVTDLPGTTRDVVESQLVVGGIPIQVLDTAGIRETEDQVEKIGVERSRLAAESADLVLFTIDAQAGFTELDREIYDRVRDRPLILVINKIDLAEPTSDLPSALQIVKTAAAQNQGIDALETAILETVQSGQIQAANMDLAINQRQAAALTRAKLALQQVQVTISNQLPLDFWTIDLRSAIQALGEILGEDVTESVLDRIFSRFCIGK
ncbi:TrmE protein [Leptolyngbya boryana NIES-2135]|jgi:tRNA modification GTPase|uniref:tRNA modification GTPase MnmE n=1 Tax=Leptolyngbya boryana NIES-2135 TaxID=1973484 RepID=A0A1Z4JF87_LEPBY|nr:MULTISPECIES: tRNA uridine-5-carboxymethylaminomethyl(34) synthesis GTPase MnmE [Leptolyngbya]BAY55435.1 TrmE protein [Leptolyngbya boryana NIES-2135]MBD2368412.1 tRNA uridine-5-carboxymethylaminomethyl(34) synthesis GTPase MnmE [Leptolyngbya sp. FACHB-161]MBD2374932.1 tRNA uridine-5-carboxymethylaminomethyl(34) synthesis GTPase MnmE [Leptolyngbya sp. FACHB-238]MBD2399352.1 tRNA uridine-5-carboxymethylaminomethyl(34) synthesis GTPase MnmE [Leptolyngbya sp. FACHB-239]MBD2405557.1 tRNA uridin